MKLVTALARITNLISSLKNKAIEYKSKIESIWKAIVISVESFWTLLVKFSEKLVELWVSTKTAIERGWENFWKSFEETSEDESINNKIMSVEPTINRDNVKRYGVNIGLLYVDRGTYGDDMRCPGSDYDALNMNKMLNRMGFTTKLFLNSDATWYNIKTYLEKLASELSEGDLLVLTAAGHGGQVRDSDGDESDGYDETWVLYDREVPDDEILSVINKFKRGVRLVFINDQCHSEGNFRSVVRGIQRSVSFGRWGKRTWNGSFTNKDEIPKYNRPELIQFAGCRENKYSYGNSSGGEWTTALIKSYEPNLSWRMWFDKASRLPRNQTPQWVEYGPVTDEFRHGRVFE